MEEKDKRRILRKKVMDSNIELEKITKKNPPTFSNPNGRKKGEPNKITKMSRSALAWALEGHSYKVLKLILEQLLN